MLLLVPGLLSLLANIIASPIPVDRSGESCLDRTDGFYVKGCNDVYMLCLKGVKYVKKCHYRKDIKLYFNPRRAMCDQTVVIDQCTGDMDQNIYYKAKYNRLSWLDIMQKPRVMCSRIYADCINVFCFEVECPKGLFYDQSRGICDEPNNLLGCRRVLEVKARSDELFDKGIFLPEDSMYEFTQKIQ